MPGISMLRLGWMNWPIGGAFGVGMQITISQWLNGKSTDPPASRSDRLPPGFDQFSKKLLPPKRRLQAARPGYYGCSSIRAEIGRLSSTQLFRRYGES